MANDWSKQEIMLFPSYSNPPFQRSSQSAAVSIVCFVIIYITKLVEKKDPDSMNTQWYLYSNNIRTGVVCNGIYVV